MKVLISGHENCLYWLLNTSVSLGTAYSDSNCSDISSKHSFSSPGDSYDVLYTKESMRPSRNFPMSKWTWICESEHSHDHTSQIYSTIGNKLNSITSITTLHKPHINYYYVWQIYCNSWKLCVLKQIITSPTSEFYISIPLCNDFIPSVHNQT